MTDTAESTIVPFPTMASAADAIVAAARKIDFQSKDDQKRYKKRQKGWQDEAWRYYDECGEVWFAANFVANCLRKVRLYAATQDDVSEPPVPIELEPDDDDPEGFVPPTPQETAAVDLIERLSRSEGGIGGIMAGFGLNLSVAGECVLVGAEDETGIERWVVHSSDEVFINTDGQWAVRSTQTDRKGVVLDENSVAYRVWRPHPRWSDMADSPMRANLDLVDELLILSRAIRATGRSRIAGAGLLLWPSEANLTTQSLSAPPTQSTAGQAVDPVLNELMTAMITPIGDEGVAAAVVPLLLKIPSQYIEHVRHILFERTIDPEMANQRKELIERLATGLDIPAEVLLGLQDSNHWTAWMIDEQTFKAHLEPLVIQICGSLTSVYLRPNLGITDPLESDILVWYDPSGLVGHPNRSQDANDAFDRYSISEEAYRRYKGFAEDDAPTDEEIQERVARKALEKVGALRAGETLGEATDVTRQEETEPGIPATGPNAGTPDTTSNSAPSPASSAIAAAVEADQSWRRFRAQTATSRLERLGWRLSHRDRELRSRLSGAADQAMFRALERAGATLRRHVSRDTTARAMIAEVENHLVVPTLTAALGPEVCQMFGVDTQAHLEDAFDSLGMRFDRETQAAQQQLRDVLDELDPDNELDMEAIAHRQAESRRDAQRLLLVALGALATARLFNPSPEAPPLGEHDSELIVPPGLLREALSIAGGAPVPPALDGQMDRPTGGVMTGDEALSDMAEVGIDSTEWEWFVGAPDRPFEPHQDLDGQTFTGWDDDVLANPEDWPDNDFFYPGDHDGCQCDAAPILGIGHH